MTRRFRAFAPATISNLGPGFDCLGLAFDAGGVLGDVVIAERCGAAGRVTLEVAGRCAARVPSEPERNGASIAARSVLVRSGLLDVCGVHLVLDKRLEVGTGLGSSAASAVAGAIAANAALGGSLDAAALVECARDAEGATASARHADNAAPCVFGGVTLLRTGDPIEVVPLPVPSRLCVAVVLPGIEVRTAGARAVLPLEVSRDHAVFEASHLGALVAALCLDDLALLGRALDDVLHVPYRKHLVPGFDDACAAALRSGAIAASLSGSGPATFALCDDRSTAARVADAMAAAYRAAGLSAEPHSGSIRTAPCAAERV